MIRIRELREHDLKEVLKIVEKTMTELDSKHAKKVLELYLKLKKLKISLTRYWVAEEKNIIGLCGWYDTKMAEGVYGIGWFCIDPKYQRKGVGSILLNSVENQIAKLGGRKIVVYSSSFPEFRASLNFYKKHGYKKEARIKDFFQKKEDAIILTKDL